MPLLLASYHSLLFYLHSNFTQSLSKIRTIKSTKSMHLSWSIFNFHINVSLKDKVPLVSGSTLYPVGRGLIFLIAACVVLGFRCDYTVHASTRRACKQEMTSTNQKDNLYHITSCPANWKWGFRWVSCLLLRNWAVWWVSAFASLLIFFSFLHFFFFY